MMLEAAGAVAGADPSERPKLRLASKHMPQLDALRAFAVFVVMVEHWVHVQHVVDWGALGVRLFFVLSGFLITGILLRYRGELEGGRPLGSLLRTFFARRFLRLSPVYLLYLAAIAVALPWSRQYMGWFVVYLQNFLFALRPKVFEVLLAHFWSLSVEEQFYLFWPAVILLTPRRRLPLVLTGIVILGPVLRALGLAAGMSGHAVRMMMPAHFDTLGLGGLIALLGSGDAPERAWEARLLRFGILVGPPIVLVGWLTTGSDLSVVVEELGMGLAFAWLIAGAAGGIGGVAGDVLDSRALQYLGRISYGIYVYHFNVPGLLRDKILPRLGLAMPESIWLSFPICAVVTVAIAAASWQLLELPVNRLKARIT
jgi:peptidoglycan/LPS O-acetylase OafA/YrhL